MIFLKQIRRFFLAITLTVTFAMIIALNVGMANSWAATSSPLSISPSHTQLIAMWGKATAKDIEGKAQETMGNLTGNPKDQMMGKAKQVESQIRSGAEDMEDQMKLKGRTKAVVKNLEGKTQEAVGNLTGNSKDQMMGKAKQVESQGRNVIEDMKDTVQDVFH
jgi:uncharacterized protein YjbJ (UPF0337 family)